jgi:hypothetical protein
MMINTRNRNWALSARTAGVCRCGPLFVRVAKWDDVANPANAISRRLGWILAEVEDDEIPPQPNSMSYDPIPYASEQGI